jgi:hypothetical protein
MMGSRSPRRSFAALLSPLAALAALLAPMAAAAQDLAGVVARARAQVESGAYADAMKTLATLPSKGVPDALAVEAALLGTTAALVTGGAEAGEAACANAVVASGYDPEVARDQSPKVRAACRAAAAKERAQRLARAQIQISGLKVDPPAVAFQPVRVAATASSVPPWLRVVARVTSSALEGSFDLALAPSLEGPLRGTLDASWIRPGARMKVEVIAQDRYGDLGPTGQSAALVVPTAEAMIALGDLPAGAMVRIDHAVVKPADGRVPIAPGKHTVSLELADGAFASAAVEVSRGGVARVALSPQRPARSRTFAWIATGTAVALGSVGGVLLLNADSRRREIEELSAKREEGSNLPAVEYSELQGKDEERATFATLGTVFLVGGGVAAAAAVTLWLWPDGSSRQGSAAVGVRVGLGGAAVVGRF